MAMVESEKRAFQELINLKSKLYVDIPNYELLNKQEEAQAQMLLK